ncbi:FHA domain-containing protein [Agromyces sp. MMS24-K17]|uniref:FHA domain-containing protein n=1 Tax=Agromyces sp. MMS24-K17 TaxID=3372850 RepID=UPI003754680C
MAEPEFIVPPPGLLPDAEPPRPKEPAPESTTRLAALNQTLGRAPIAVPAAPLPPAPLPPGPGHPPALTRPPAPPQLDPTHAAPAPPAAPPAPPAPAPAAPAASAPAPPNLSPAPVTAPTPIPTFGAGAGYPPAQPAPRAVPAWRLRTSVGGEIVVAGRVVLGRAPSADDYAPGTVVVPLHDPARTVSKVHAIVEPVDGALLVADANSTNGVRIRRPNGDVLDLAAGTSAHVEPGSVLELGRFELAVEGPAPVAR